jgi:hypothetical protein
MSPPFRRVLVANRGEIALRIVRACHELGMEAVAVYSDADASAAHVRAADVAVRLGPAPSAESYLRAEAVLAAAIATGAEAIHPGYGFLAENAVFARACGDREVGFVISIVRCRPRSSFRCGVAGIVQNRGGKTGVLAHLKFTIQCKNGSAAATHPCGDLGNSHIGFGEKVDDLADFNFRENASLLSHIKSSNPWKRKQ